MKLTQTLIMLGLFGFIIALVIALIQQFGESWWINVSLLPIIILVANLKVKKTQKMFHNVKGHQASNPTTGNFNEIGEAGSLHQYLVKNHNEFGPIFSFYWGQTQVVSLGRPDYFKTVQNLFDRPPELFNLFEPLIGKKSIQYANGQEGKGRIKRYMKPGLVQQVIDDNYMDIFETVYKSIQDSFNESLGKSSSEIELQNTCFSIALKSIIQIAFRHYINDDQIQQIINAYNICWHEMENRMIGSFPEQNSDRQNSFDQQLAFLHSISKQVLEKARKNESKKYFIDFLKEEGDEEIIINDIITMLIGGSHTTSNLLTWIIIYLSQNQEKQIKLQQELDEFIETDQQINSNILHKLKYTKNVVKEAIRLSILAPWGARINYENDTEFPNGEIIPKGTPMILSYGYLLQDQKLWGEDANQFLPERFDKPITQNFNFSPYHPFGYAGGRVCPGMQLANTEAAVFTAYIFKNYSISLKNENQDIKQIFGLVTSPSTDIIINIKKRN